MSRKREVFEAMQGPEAYERYQERRDARIDSVLHLAFQLGGIAFLCWAVWFIWLIWSRVR